MSAKPAVEIYSRHTDHLGEAPLWSASEQTLYWLDIAQRRLYRRAPHESRSHEVVLPGYPGCLAEVSAGVVTVAMGEGIQQLTVRSGDTQLLCKANDLRAGTRFNDGKVDPLGRFWVTIMQNNFGPQGEDIAIDRSDGALYCFDPGGKGQKIEDDLGVPNTLAWSPDEKLFYFADSLKGQIFVYDFDLESGSLRNQRLFFETQGRGIPDGSAMDTEGCLWNARWDGSCILRITPEGRVDRMIDMPVQRPTSCCFGGPKLDTLFVTSASLGLSPAELQNAPLSGAVFAIPGLVQGMPVPSFLLGV